jgi:elongation factor G
MDPEGQREGGPTAIPAEVQAQVDENRETLLDAVVLTDESLMERYLEGQELTVEEVAHALKVAVTRGEVFPVA